ncbi:TPA: hypothetical protein KTG44_005284, partial [Escherichia coli]|nr:hypothetical protein [Escherichia coli]
VSAVTVHHHVNQGGVAADVHSITVPRGNSGQGGCTIQTTGIYIYIFKANAISMLAHTSDTGVSSSGNIPKAIQITAINAICIFAGGTNCQITITQT